MRWCPQNELLCSAEIPVVGCLACNVVTLRRCVTDRGNERMALTSSNHQPPSFLYHHSVASHSFASSQRHLRPRFCLLTFFAIHILFQVELLLLSKVLYETDKCLFCAFLLFVIERQPEIAINCTFFYGKGSWISLISAERELSYCHQTLPIRVFAILRTCRLLPVIVAFMILSHCCRGGANNATNVLLKYSVNVFS